MSGVSPHFVTGSKVLSYCFEFNFLPLSVRKTHESSWTVLVFFIYLFFSFTLPRLTSNLLQYDKSYWQVVALTVSFCILLSCVLIIAVYLFLVFSFKYSLHLLSLAPHHPLSLYLPAESLCFSARSSRAPSASGRQRWWREESSPPMFSSSSVPHCWLHTCSHLESGETHARLDNCCYCPAFYSWHISR